MFMSIMSDKVINQPAQLCIATAPKGRIARTVIRADNPEPPARGTSELKTRSASALLEQYEARLGQHPLLARGQAAAGLASRQVADYLNDLDQIP
jgi:hypothetical protein